MKFDFNSCLYPKGSLWITFDNFSQRVQLKRCLWHEPFISLSPDEYYDIEDIISYFEKFNYEKTEYLSKSESLKCNSKCELNKGIKNVSVSISHACNLRCYHCYFDNNHYDSDIQKKLYFDTLYKIKGHNLDKILLTDNGEPFYYYIDTIEYLNSLAYGIDTKVIEITTNLTLLSKDKILKLKDISKASGIKYRFIVSFDGITKESFESTRIGGKWEKAIANLEYLIESFGTDDLVVSYVIRKPALEYAQYAKDFFKKKFNIRADIYYDFYDEECKKAFLELNHLECPEKLWKN